MDWFKISLQLNKFPIQRAQKKLEEVKNIPEAEYEKYLYRQRNFLLDHHIQHNNFYRDFFEWDGYNEWKNVPIMNKSNLQQPLIQRLSDSYSRKNAYVGKTSGSSGHPFIFAKNKFAHALSWAGFQDRYSWYGIDLNTSLQARFYGIPLDFFGNVQERLKDRISLRRRFNIFDLSEQRMETFLKRFKKANFNYLNGYTSAILLFAKFLKDRRIVLKEMCPSLEICIVTSERLFENDKKLIEQVIGVPVINEYGASEVGLIAFEDKNHDWIVNAEDLYVEILDEQDRILPYGEEGRIVITALYNLAHPMIRYDIGDTGSLSSRSTPKKPILENLVGRTSDIARLPNGKVVPGLTFYYVTKTIIEDAGKIREFVITQTNLDSFEIEYVSDLDLEPAQKKQILKAINIYVGKDLQVTFKRNESLKRTKNGKLKQFTSLVP